MALVPRKGLERIRPAVHGGPDFAELRQSGISPESLIDFSVGLNPLGPPPSLARKLAGLPFDTYPDSRAAELCQALARRLGVGPENVIAGNGSSELIWLAALAYFSPGDRVIIVAPTFGEYERACLIAGGRPVKLAAGPPSFSTTPGEIIAAARKHRAKGVFLCNPNNPTGAYLPRRDIEEILGSLPDTLLVLDEAYVAFTDKVWASEGLIAGPPVAGQAPSGTKATAHRQGRLCHPPSEGLVSGPPLAGPRSPGTIAAAHRQGRLCHPLHPCRPYGNVLILRSMTKDYGLAGLRLGYALGSEEIISNLKRVCPPWNVNSIAQQAGIFVLEEGEHLRRGQAVIRESRRFLFAELAKLGLEPVPSSTNFFLVRVGDAAALRRKLLKKGLLVRDCASFGLPEYIRLAALKLPDCQRLVEALKEANR